RTGSPSDRVIFAPCEVISSVPWVMRTPPDRVLTLSPLDVPLWCPAWRSIGLLRSELRAPTAVATASSDTATAAARARAAGRRGRWLGDMAGVHLRLEFVMPGGEVRLQADALQYRTRLGDGDARRGGRQVALWEYVQLRGFQRDLALARRAVDAHVAAQPQLVALGRHPAVAGLDAPVVAVRIRQQEGRGRERHRLPGGVAGDPRRAQGERFRTVVVQCDQLDVVQDVVRAPGGGGAGFAVPAVAQHRPRGHHRGHQ